MAKTEIVRRLCSTLYLNICLLQDDAVPNAKCRDGAVVQAEVSAEKTVFAIMIFHGKISIYHSLALPLALCQRVDKR